MKKFIIAILFLSGCASGMKASDHRADIRDDKGDRITVGKVQSQIKDGMPSSEIIEILGSPNIVSTDKDSLEVWTYDKISTENIASGSSYRGWGWGESIMGGASSSSQRTLTIIIKFDEKSRVRNVAYRTSRF